MPPKPLAEVFGPTQAELVFALVAAAGTDITQVEHDLTHLLGKQYRYRTVTRKLSDMAKAMAGLGHEIAPKPEYERLKALQDAGDKIRRDAGRGDVLALHVIGQIYGSRPHEEMPLHGVQVSQAQPLVGTAHILRTLKHPAEVEALRRVYGSGFFLIGVHASHEDRHAFLQNILGMTADEASEIMTRDESNPVDEFGQQTRKTFFLSDVFVRTGDSARLQRFLELIFQAPFQTPTPEEHAMFLAFAAGLRSAQPGRQVGAVVVSAHGEVIATGANDVPQYRGGLYWPGPTDQRDHKYNAGQDSNKRQIDEIKRDLIDRVKGYLKEDVDPEVVLLALKKSKLDDITEFGRAVHAEMEALLACARIGVSPRDGRLFTTTFPCHNCAKHIVAAGIREVVFVEPYPKSKATDLHKDSIAVDTPNAEGMVKFSPFVGVAARRYFDLFSMRLGAGLPLVRRDGEGGIATWKARNANVRIRMSPYSYIARERLAVAEIPTAEPDPKPDSPIPA